MKELQGHDERLQRENDQLWAQIEKNHNLGKDVRDIGQAGHPITCNRGKEPIILDDVNTSADDELSSGGVCFYSEYLRWYLFFLLNAEYNFFLA